jgi:hypothetical protein
MIHDKDDKKNNDIGWYNDCRCDKDDDRDDNFLLSLGAVDCT